MTGGLGGTPDDLTREGVAATFGVDCVEIEPLAGNYARASPRGLGEYAARWACLPAGAEPLENPLGGAPGFQLGNVYVLPGLPSEMEAMFDSVAERFEGSPIGRGAEPCGRGGQIVQVLEEATGRYPVRHGRELPALRRRRAGSRRRPQVERRAALEAASLGRSRADSLLAVDGDVAR